MKYFKSGASWFSCSFLIFLLVLAQVCNTGNDYWISFWTNTELIRKRAGRYNLTEDEVNEWTNKTFLSKFGLDEYGLFPTHYFIRMYTITIGMVILTNYIKSLYFMRILTKANLALHNQMFTKVLRATMRFFTLNPSGKF